MNGGARPAKTDAQLRHDLEEELEWDSSVDSGAIADAVRDGIVTLTGETSSLTRRWSAERAVERVAGVRGIANRIEVRGVGEHSDTEIATAAANALRWNAQLPADQVVVSVDHGWVSLSGEVHHGYQRQAAEQGVRHLRGVTGVSNRISVEPHVEARDGKHGIELAFERHALVDAKEVRATVFEGEVTVSGHVRSWAERNDAVRCAWAGPGVTSVVDLSEIINPEDEQGRWTVGR
jgi:osmotically-inducible protein OsmY